MIRRNFLKSFAGVLGGFVGFGIGSTRADVPVSCPYCGSPSIPRRRYLDATEYVCLDCASKGDIPLIAYSFTRKANDPDYYVFFPADIDRMFRDTPGSNFEPAGADRRRSVIDSR